MSINTLAFYSPLWYSNTMNKTQEQILCYSILIGLGFIGVTYGGILLEVFMNVSIGFFRFIFAPFCLLVAFPYWLYQDIKSSRGLTLAQRYAQVRGRTAYVYGKRGHDWTN